MRPIALSTTGSLVSASDNDAGSQGASREGKSSGGLVLGSKALEGEAVGVRGDGGGDTYAREVFAVDSEKS